MRGFQHFIRDVGIAVIAQREQDIGSARKSRSDPIIVLFYQRDEIFRRFGTNGLGKHLKVQGQDVSRLKFLLQFSVAVRQNTAIGVGNLFADCPILRCVLCVAQNRRDFGKQPRRTRQRRRSRPFTARLPFRHLRDVGRYPIPELHRGDIVPNIFVFSERKESRPKQARLDVFFHDGIHFFENVFIPVSHVLRPRHEHARVAPECHRFFRHGLGKTVTL